MTNKIVRVNVDMDIYKKKLMVSIWVHRSSGAVRWYGTSTWDSDERGARLLRHGRQLQSLMVKRAGVVI